MKIYYKLLESLRNRYLNLVGSNDLHIRPEDIAYSSVDASELIYQTLSDSNPCMISRFGSVELTALNWFLESRKGHHYVVEYITGKCSKWWNNEPLCNELRDNAGFFPADENYVQRFVDLVCEDLKQIDVLGSWVKSEEYIAPLLSHTHKVFLRDLEPFWVEHPWTRALEGKKVLVVHPFANQILKQYKDHRGDLFENKDILPNFSLEVIPAVQSIGGESNGFKDWFEALQWMKDEIDKHDYDVCLIGCGAYGMSLAAHVKRTGKKAVHLAGALQLLFGIIGNRWADPNYGVKEWGIPMGSYSGLINEYWVRPGEQGRPKNAEKVEGACYW